MLVPEGREGVKPSLTAGVPATLPPVAQNGLYRAGWPHPQPAANGSAVFVVGGPREGDGRTEELPAVAMVTGFGGREGMVGLSSCSL